MTKEQLIETAVKYVYREISEDVFLTAVDAYSSASNDGKQIVSGSLPLDEKLSRVFEANSDCYADTWEDCGDELINGKHLLKEGNVIQAMTKGKFIEVVKLIGNDR